MTSARARVLEALQEAVEPVTAAELATHLGLHPNTAREHLDALVDRGLATPGRVRARRRGRPATSYTASVDMREPDARVRGYATLALVLAEQIAASSPNAVADAIDAGRIWGRILTEDMPATTPARARRQTVAMLRDIGFNPAVAPHDSRVVLRSCPFLDLARQQSPVVCSVHLGIITEVMSALGGGGTQVQLLPFAEPHGCVVTFALPAA